MRVRSRLEINVYAQSTIDSEGFKGGTRGSPIMPRDAVSRTAHVGTVGTNRLRSRLQINVFIGIFLYARKSSIGYRLSIPSIRTVDKK